MALSIYSETFEVLYNLVLKEARKKLTLEQRKSISETSHKNWDEDIVDLTSSKQISLMNWVFGDKAPTNSQYWANRLSAHRKPKNKNGSYKDECLDENSELMIKAFNLISFNIPDNAKDLVVNNDLEARILYQFFVEKHFDYLFKKNKHVLEIYDADMNSIFTERLILNSPSKKYDDNLNGYSLDNSAHNQDSGTVATVALNQKEIYLQSSADIINVIEEFYTLISGKDYEKASNLFNGYFGINGYLELLCGYLWTNRIEDIHVWDVSAGIKEASCRVYFVEYIDSFSMMLAIHNQIVKFKQPTTIESQFLDFLLASWRAGNEIPETSVIRDAEIDHDEIKQRWLEYGKVISETKVAPNYKDDGRPPHTRYRLYTIKLSKEYSGWKINVTLPLIWG
ncbi:hypothetical protein [Pedobacter sp. MC2016-24]|uniref:hypothetical protein n=1 Tax=Pedobacter sp. MC2016-24 TaxID=2780090 RepID=UPI00188233A8|nr:hypothetical protein [Pedobacter sp. MC2016-24]MBE9602644.1 hypothetical protein [Pedobacter sp. MC2016-24]